VRAGPPRQTILTITATGTTTINPAEGCCSPPLTPNVRRHVITACGLDEGEKLGGLLSRGPVGPGAGAPVHRQAGLWLAIRRRLRGPLRGRWLGEVAGLPVMAGGSVICVLPGQARPAIRWRRNDAAGFRSARGAVPARPS
jgi:hypothetical protein